MDVDIATHMEDEEDMLGQLDLAPDSSAFAVLLKEFERPDIASDVFLKVLDEWRVRVNADEADPFP
jgi:hypothetical protein